MNGKPRGERLVARVDLAGKGFVVRILALAGLEHEHRLVLSNRFAVEPKVGYRVIPSPPSEPSTRDGIEYMVHMVSAHGNKPVVFLLVSDSY